MQIFIRGKIDIVPWEKDRQKKVCALRIWMRINRINMCNTMKITLRCRGWARYRNSCAGGLPLIDKAIPSQGLMPRVRWRHKYGGGTSDFVVKIDDWGWLRMVNYRKGNNSIKTNRFITHIVETTSEGPDSLFGVQVINRFIPLTYYHPQHSGFSLFPGVSRRACLPPLMCHFVTAMELWQQCKAV